MDIFLNIEKIIVAIRGIAMYLSFPHEVVTGAKARREAQAGWQPQAQLGDGPAKIT